MSKHNFVVSEPKSSICFAFNVEQIVVKNAVNGLSISWFIPEIFMLKIESCPKMRALSILGKSKWANTTSWLVNQSSSNFLFQCKKDSSL